MSSQYISSLKGTTLSGREKKATSQNSSPTSFEDEDDYACDLSSFVHQFNFTRTEAESLTLDEYLGVPVKDMNRPDSLLNNLMPQGSLSDLSDLLTELDNFELSAPQISASRFSMLLLPDDNEDTTVSEATQAAPLTDFEKKIEIAKKRLETANLKKITTTIYVIDAKNPQPVQLTSLSTPDSVVKGFIENGTLSSDREWILVEIHEAFGVERVMKPWEPIMDVIDAWEPECHSALLIRARFNEATTSEVPRVPPIMSGWLQVEIRRGKWEKRFVVLKRGGIYVAKSEAVLCSAVALCSLQNFDTFTLARPRAKSPNKPQFAIKSQQSIALFEKPEEDYIHFFACGSYAELDTWVRALRYSRSWVHYEMFLSRPATAALFSPFIDDTILTDHLRGIDIDVGQYQELEGGIKPSPANSTLTRNTAGAIAGRLFRLVLTGDQGKTDINRVVGSKPLPNVFAEGSLLSKPHVPKPTSCAEDAEVAVEDGEVFKEGSLLSQGVTVKKPVAAATATSEYQPQSGTLLSSIASQKPNKVKPQPLVISTGKSPLLHLRTKDSGVFQTGTLLSKASTPTSSANSSANSRQMSQSQKNCASSSTPGATSGGTSLMSPGGLYLSGMNGPIGARKNLSDSPTSPNVSGSLNKWDVRGRELSQDSPTASSPNPSSNENSPHLGHVGNVFSQQQHLRKQRSHYAIPDRSNVPQMSVNGLRDLGRSFSQNSLKSGSKSSDDHVPLQIIRHASAKEGNGFVKSNSTRHNYNLLQSGPHPQYRGVPHNAMPPQMNPQFMNSRPPIAHSSSARMHPPPHNQIRALAPNSHYRAVAGPPPTKGPLIQLDQPPIDYSSRPGSKKPLKPLISFK